jgi:flagellar biosynthesis anti-sigma factor FlgM
MVDRINPTSGDQRINRPTDSGPAQDIDQNRATRGVGGSRADALGGEAAGRVAGDSVDISGEAAFRSRALESVRNAPDVREDRVAALREAIASGNYNVTSTELAARLLGHGES